jgi:hypothetical protein
MPNIYDYILQYILTLFHSKIKNDAPAVLGASFLDKNVFNNLSMYFNIQKNWDNKTVVKVKDTRHANNQEEFGSIDSLKQYIELTVREGTQKYFATYTKQDSNTLIKDIRAYCKEDNDTEFLCDDENITIFKYITELQD